MNRYGATLLPQGAFFKTVAVAAVALVGFEIVGGLASGGFPVFVEAQARPAAIAAPARPGAAPTETIDMHFRNFDDEGNQPNLFFHVERTVDGRTETAHLVGATGSCYVNGDNGTVNLFSWFPGQSRDCTVSYTLDGGPGQATVKFDHRSGIPVTPMWFGNQTTYTEKGLG